MTTARELLEQLAAQKLQQVQAETAQGPWPPGMESKGFPPQTLRAVSGAKQSAAGLLATLMDASDPRGLPGMHMQQRFAQDEAARLVGVPEAPVAEALGGAAPYLALPAARGGRAARLAYNTATGALAGAAANPGERLAGGAIGGALGLGIGGVAEGGTAGIVSLANKVKPLVEVSRKIGDEARAVADQMLPRGQRGFARNLVAATDFRLKKLSNAADVVWERGLEAARNASGGQDLIPKGTPMNFRTVLQEEIDSAVLNKGLGDWVDVQLAKGLTTDTMNTILKRLTRVGKSSDASVQSAIADVKNEFLKDLAQAKGAGAKEIQQMRLAYGQIAREKERVTIHVLKRIFGTDDVFVAKGRADVNYDKVLEKYASLSEGEQLALTQLLDKQAPRVLKQTQGALFANALNKSYKDGALNPEMLIKNLAGTKDVPRLFNLMSPEQAQATAQAIGRWRGLVDRDVKKMGAITGPWDLDRIVNIAVRVPGGILSRIKSDKGIRELALMPEGQAILSKMSQMGPGSTPAAVADLFSPWFVNLLQEEGILKK